MVSREAVKTSPTDCVFYLFSDGEWVRVCAPLVASVGGVGVRGYGEFVEEGPAII